VDIAPEIRIAALRRLCFNCRMKVLLLCLLASLFTCTAVAEIRKSSRNLQPLTKKPEAEEPAEPAPQPEAPPAAAAKAAFSGPKAGWGFVKATSPCYAPDGKRLGTLPGGTLFKYDGVKSTSRNAVLISTVKHGDAWAGPFLLDCTDVASFEGDPGALDPATVKDLADYFTLSGRLADRKAELEEKAFAANPHFAAAKAAMAEYQASVEKAAALEKEMNALTGPRKAKADDALRAFKYEQVRIKDKADKAAAAYKAWKDANPPDTARIAADPQLQTLQKELQAARKPVAALLPADS
jgi:hypothetical protein